MPSLVVDASLVARLLVRSPELAQVRQRWDEWVQNRMTIAAPTLLIYEVVNTLHKAWSQKTLTLEELQSGLDLIASFPIHYYDSLDLATRATQITRDLHMSSVYDSFYVALAEVLQCEFWTGDKRLRNNALSRNIPFVRSIWSD